MPPVRLVTVAPGHFHAALIQKRMRPGVDRRAHVYGPLDADLPAHLARVAAFNARPDDPTAWELEVHAGPDYRERFLRERPGNVVVLSGRNRGKIDLMLAAAEAGLHVLADKPWVIDAADLPKLEATLAAAARTGAVVYDIMTERYEITSLLQRELVRDPAVFGSIEAGTPDRPAVFMESVHYLKKLVAGTPLKRPAWFFDVGQQGEALADVGTHLVDLVLWMLCTDPPADFRRDVQILSARRWPTPLNREQFREVTGEADFPESIRPFVVGERFDYPGNNAVTFALRGVKVGLSVRWDYEAPPGGTDAHEATFRGSRASVVIRQPAGHPKPELFVVPDAGEEGAARAALEEAVRRWQGPYPGVGTAEVNGEFRVDIPELYRVGHEAHFAQVLDQFLSSLDRPEERPAWEAPNLLAKYAITTRGVEAGRTR